MEYSSVVLKAFDSESMVKCWDPAFKVPWSNSLFTASAGPLRYEPQIESITKTALDRGGFFGSFLWFKTA